MKCIYCFENKPSYCFEQTEHVLPQSFGKFKNNLTLNIKNNPKLKEVVCDDCNDYFGKNLEISLGRDTLEGMTRFDHKIKKTNEFKSPGKKSRIEIKIDEKPFKGAYAYREYSELEDGIIIKPLPQVGFKKVADTDYEYFLLDNIPQKEYLDNNFDLAGPKSIVVLGCDVKVAQRHLAEKNISFNPGGEFCPPAKQGDWECEVTFQIDQTILRALAKIAFNYLAHWAGPELVIKKMFHPIRKYIRFGKETDYPFVVIIEKAILGDEPIVGKRRVGHLITLDWSKNKLSIVSQVSLFNWTTYHILLAKNYQGERVNIRRGSFFNIADNEIVELVPKDSIKD